MRIPRALDHLFMPGFVQSLLRQLLFAGLFILRLFLFNRMPRGVGRFVPRDQAGHRVLSAIVIGLRVAPVNSLLASMKSS